jgi:KipI family sensor histidine kinase inhibitor
MPDSLPRIERLGDSALLLEWTGADLAAGNAAVHRTAAALRRLRPPWLIDLVPAYLTLAVLVDPDAGEAALVLARTCLLSLGETPSPGADAAEQRCVEVPVCYDLEFGPDLAAIADAKGLTVAEVISHHSSPLYRVAMLGFAAGFPYLLGLDPVLAMPRLATPRERVPAGSVGIGGSQTGIYPSASPGGWRLLGRTPWRLFDPDRDPPARLLPGDNLRFVPISRRDFEAASS